MITTGAVGVPMGNSQSGFRIVRLGPTVESRYYELGGIPHAIDAAKPLPTSPGSTQ